MLLEHFIETTVPFVIHVLEAMGIFVVIVAALKAFVKYVRSIFRFNDHNIKIELAKALAFSLELKLGGEILKTVIVRDLNEMLILAAIIGLRALLAFVIHWEIGADTKHSNESHHYIEPRVKDTKVL
jgi:uncharacterized membrane protein